MDNCNCLDTDDCRHKHLLNFVIGTGIIKKFKINKQKVPQAVYDALENNASNIEDKRIVNHSFLYYDQFLEVNPHLIDMVDTAYKALFDVKKKAGNIYYGKADINDGKTRRFSGEYFELFMFQRKGCKIMTYHQDCHEWDWVDVESYKLQFKDFRKLVKKNHLIVEESGKDTNQSLDKNKNLVGKEWYSLILAHPGGNNPCLGTIEVFDKYKEGFVYYFYDKKDRDNAFNYLNGIKI